MSKMFDHYPETQILRCDCCGEFFEDNTLYHTIRIDGHEFEGEFSREFIFCGASCRDNWLVQNEE